MQSLDLTSKHFGYAGWKKAQQTLPSKPFKVTVEAAFINQDNGVEILSLTLPFKKSRDELYHSSKKQALRFFDYEKKRDAFTLIFETTSQQEAQNLILQAFRQLYFMQETGLVPYLSTDGKNITGTQIPFEFFNQPSKSPYFDHHTFWKDPESQHLVIVNQPFKQLYVNFGETPKKTEYGFEIEKWMGTYGFVGDAVQHRGFYLDGRASTFIMFHENSGYALQELIQSFRRVPDQLLEKNWKYFKYQFLTVS
jgi:hypothetical protein